MDRHNGKLIEISQFLAGSRTGHRNLPVVPGRTDRTAEVVEKKQQDLLQEDQFRHHFRHAARWGKRRAWPTYAYSAP